MDEDNEALDDQITIRISKRLRQTLERLAKHERRKLADYVRLALDEYARARTEAHDDA